MLKETKVTAVGLILMLLFSVIASAAFAAPATAATAQQQATAREMVEKFQAYHETFSSQEQAEIKDSYDALKSLSDAQWKTLVDDSGLKTAELIAKYDTEADAEEALTELLKDTYQILYAVYDETVLYDACLEFVVDETPTIHRIFDGLVTPPMLVALVEDSEKTLAGFDISGSISDNASDYWNVVYGMGKNYIDSVDNVIELAIEKTIENSVLKTKMTELKWETKPFADLHEKIIELVDSDFRANTVLYDSILRKHSALINTATGEVVKDGQDFVLTEGQSLTMKFTIFGKNVSIPFGSYIQLPSDGSLIMTTDQTAGTFKVTAVKEINGYDMIVRRGVVGSDELVNTANVFKTFSITCRTSASPAPTPTHKVDFHPNTSPQPTATPELGAVILENPAEDKAEVILEEKEANREYQLRLLVNGVEVQEGTVQEGYRIAITIPTDWKDTQNVVLYYMAENGEKVIVDQANVKDGVITANVNYIGTYYLEKTSIAILEENHVLYLVGDDQGLFQPNADMTRAEVAQMFYHLLKEKDVISGTSFTDVDDNAWYATAVKVLASYKIINGYEGMYRPEDSITREEFTTIAVKFVDVIEEGDVTFTDVKKGDWSYPYILTAAAKGWISGYEDGSFRPQGMITRAEVTSIVNRMLNRVPDEEYIDAHAAELKIFPDVSDREYWAYYQIVEATNTHDCEILETKETWK